jgi:hypothetical protein
MRIDVLIVLFLLLLSCSTERNSRSSQGTADSSSEIDQIDSKEDSVIEVDISSIPLFYEVSELPKQYFNGDSSAIVNECGDAAYWSIVKLGKDAVPFLVSKIESASLTSVKHPCFDEMITEGVLAFILLEEILNIPYFVVFEMQYDVLEMNCKFPSGLLEDVRGRPEFFHDKLSSWYEKEKNNYQLVEVEEEDRSDCQIEFDVTQVLRSE